VTEGIANLTEFDAVNLVLPAVVSREEVAERTWLSRFGWLCDRRMRQSSRSPTIERALVGNDRSAELVKRSRTSLTTKWRTLRETSERAESISDVPATRLGIWTKTLSVMCISSFVDRSMVEGMPRGEWNGAVGPAEATRTSANAGSRRSSGRTGSPLGQRSSRPWAVVVG
jgi:hypothetical protein